MKRALKMTYQYELDFKNDYILDILDAIRLMAHINSTLSHSEKTVNFPAFNALLHQSYDLVDYALDTLNLDYLEFILQSRLYSIDLYWGI